MVLCVHSCIHGYWIYHDYDYFKNEFIKKSIGPNAFHTLRIAAVCDGEVIALSEVKDTLFSQGILGDGVAILAASDGIYAPISGVISVVYKTKHAIGITTEEGVEILVHIGIDTVRLDGKYFETFVQQNDHVVQGQKLASFDRKQIETEGFDASVLVIVTNANSYEQVEKYPQLDVFVGDCIMEVR